MKEELVRKLAQDHWNFIEKLLEPKYIINDIPVFEKSKLEYLYKEAIIHGFKHGEEEVEVS